MECFDLLVSALSGLKLPVFCEFYDKKRDNSKVPNIGNVDKGFIVVNYSYGMTAVYGDDRSVETVTGVQVHYYTRNHKADSKAVVSALEAAGFAVGGRRRMYENDTGIVHFVVECEIDD